MTGLKPLKHYSQNFLLQPQLFTQFVKPHTQVIEIGCGTGNITKQLLKLNPVIGIEIDTRFKPILDSLGFEYHLGSILNPEMSKIVNDKFKEIQMVGNLPFNISGPFCAMMSQQSLLQTHWFKQKCEILVLVEKEFGNKLLNRKRTRLGTLTQAAFDIEPKLVFGSHLFSPKPKTDAVLLHFRSKRHMNPQDLDKFQNFIRKLHLHPNKKSKHNVPDLPPELQDLRSYEWSIEDVIQQSLKH